MNILIYSANFAPEPTGIGKYSGEMAEWLASQGHEVRVVAAPPYYPSWRVADGYRWPLYRKEAWKGCTVWRAPLWVPDTPGGLKRVLHLASFAISSIPVMLAQWAWKPDVVLTVAPSFMCSPMGWLTARVTGATAWVHIQDFEVDAMHAMGLANTGSLGRKLSFAIESWLMRRFDRVSSISPNMVARLGTKGVDASKIVEGWVIRNERRAEKLSAAIKAIEENGLEAVRRAGGDPIEVAVGSGAPEQLLAGVDGLVLTGGGDVDQLGTDIVSPRIREADPAPALRSASFGGRVPITGNLKDAVEALEREMINQGLIGLGIQIVVNRDRWQETEADSGSNLNDVMRGDNLERVVGDEH